MSSFSLNSFRCHVNFVIILCGISSEIPVLQEFISSECLWYMRKYHTHDILGSAVKHNLVPVNLGMCWVWHVSKVGDSPSSKDFMEKIRI